MRHAYDIDDRHARWGAVAGFLIGVALAVQLWGCGFLGTLFAVVALILTGAISFLLLRRPNRVELDDSGRIAFVSPLGVREIEVSALLGIRRAENKLVMEHRGGREELAAPHFDGLMDFVTRVHALNPGVQLEGIL